ncbi:hypothetical protein F9543_25105 [Escherichia coli]|nr:hypothetical protein [Escherichia coli]ELZ1119575.1 hypothetical protein [Escherichia coli]
MAAGNESSVLDADNSVALGYGSRLAP